MTTIIACRGIGETLKQNMILGAEQAPRFTKWFDGIAKIQECPYPANYGPVGSGAGESYADSLNRGMEMLDEQIWHLGKSEDIYLCGYSAGATLAGDYAAYGSHRDRLSGVGCPQGGGR